MNDLRIDLLRHGMTEYGNCFLGRTDAALTAEGWQQMEQGVAAVVPQDYERIYCSPLQRCAAFGLEWAGCRRLQLDERLREYDFGDWDGATAAQIHAHDPESLGRFWVDPWHNPPPNGEPLSEFFDRLESLVDELQQRHRGAVLLICHGGVIRALHAILNGLPVSEMFNYPVGHGSLHSLRDARR